MKKIIKIMGIIILINCLYAQGNKQEITAYKKYSDGILIAGWKNSNKTIKSDIFFTKYNNSLNIIWKKIYCIKGRHSFPIVIHKCQEGYILLGGGTTAFVLCLNEAGVVIWNKFFSGRSWKFFYDISKANNGYMIIGTERLPESTDEVWIIKLDIKGEIVWNKKLAGRKAKRIINVKQNYFAITETKKGEIYIYKLNENGNIIWKKAIKKQGEDNEIINVELLKNNLFIFNISDKYDREKRIAHLYQINEAGDCVWSKKINIQHENRTYTTMQKIKNKKIIIAGNYLDNDPSNGVFFTENRGILYNIYTADGMLVLENKIHKASKLYSIWEEKEKIGVLYKKKKKIYITIFNKKGREINTVEFKNINNKQ